MTFPNSRTWLNLEPKLGQHQQRFLEFCARIEKEARRTDGTLSGPVLRRLRREIALVKNHPYSLDDIKLNLALSVTLDLVGQTWRLKVRGEDLFVRAPLIQEGSPALEKERIRKAHLVERDTKL